MELIKQIVIKDFDHFEDHRSFLDEKTDELFGSSLFLMKGEKWRDMRATLSPAFTGSKMRQMFELVSECADDMAKHFQKQASSGQKVVYEMKDLFSRYTNDVIASCAFGIKVNSLKDVENDFFMTGKRFMKFTDPKAMVKFLIIRAVPKLAKYFGIEFIDKEVSSFFRSMVIDTMDIREEKNIFRPDMINILMQVRKGTIQNQSADDKIVSNDNDGFATVEESDIGKATVIKRQWTDNEVVAQCFLFFLAGFDTSSTLITFLSYELALNPDVQKRLYEEIRETSETLNGKRVNYDAIQKMKYMDQVITETLRKWPPAAMVDRICVKDYVFDDGDVKLNIKKGTPINLPIYGIHHDPEYYPDPEKFDPERFSEENKDNIVPGSYVPFGFGPRNCIGKLAICYFVLVHLTI